MKIKEKIQKKQKQWKLAVKLQFCGRPRWFTLARLHSAVLRLCGCCNCFQSTGLGLGPPPQMEISLAEHPCHSPQSRPALTPPLPGERPDPSPPSAPPPPNPARRPPLASPATSSRHRPSHGVCTSSFIGSTETKLTKLSAFIAGLVRTWKGGIGFNFVIFGDALQALQTGCLSKGWWPRVCRKGHPTRPHPHPEKEEGQREKGFVVCCPFFENMQKNVVPALGRGLGKSEGISTLYARTLQLVVGSVVWS